jgi:putative methyltransferase
MNFYRDASDILEKIENKKGTIKGLTLSDKVRDKKKMFAIICQTLKCNLRIFVKKYINFIIVI